MGDAGVVVAAPCMCGSEASETGPADASVSVAGVPKKGAAGAPSGLAPAVGAPAASGDGLRS